jgi:uncharacterized RDD family membrane protein YckC
MAAKKKTPKKAAKRKTKPGYCSKCGKKLESGAKFCSSCGKGIGKRMRKAGIGARFMSWLIDIIVVNVIGFIVGFAFGWFFWYLPQPTFTGLAYLIGILLSAFYYTYFFGKGQTPGMMALEIKLCRANGKYPIGYGRGFGRWLGMLLSTIIIGLGFLWIAIDKNRQGWHDKIADTYVIKK